MRGFLHMHSTDISHFVTFFSGRGRCYLLNSEYLLPRRIHFSKALFLSFYFSNSFYFFKISSYMIFSQKMDMCNGFGGPGVRYYSGIYLLYYIQGRMGGSDFYERTW